MYVVWRGHSCPRLPAPLENDGAVLIGRSRPDAYSWLESRAGVPAPHALQQFPRSQIPHQCQVRFQEIVLRQVFRLSPLDVPENAVLDLSLILAHDVEAKLHHAPIWVFVLNAPDFVSDGG